MKGEILGIFDVAQVTLYVFFVFFIGLVFYLQRETRREGYPLFSEPSNTLKPGDDFFIPAAKVFKLANGTEVRVPDDERIDLSLGSAEKIAVWPGAPIEPVGDPMLAEVGPGAYAKRADRPDLMVSGAPKIVPFRVAPAFDINVNDRDPRGFALVGSNGVTVGTIKDVWIDRSEIMIRYLEAELNAAGAKPGRSVMVPMNFVRIDSGRGVVKVKAIMGSQFGNVPALKSPDQITFLEEEKVTAYYGAGTLYSDPMRAEPLL
jgi:photosynthetic reaction center H subunit